MVVREACTQQWRRRWLLLGRYQVQHIVRITVPIAGTTSPPHLSLITPFPPLPLPLLVPLPRLSSIRQYR